MWSDTLVLGQLVDQLWFEHFPDEDSSKRSGPKPMAPLKVHLKVLLIDLYVSWCSDPNMYLGVSMSKSGWKSNSRYNSRNLSFQMVKVIKRLELVGIIDLHTGQQGTLTRIRASEKLQLLFYNLKLPISEVSFDEKREAVILRDKATERDDDDISKASKNKKKPALEYEDTPETERMRRVLTKYNELLNKTYLDVCSLEEPYFERVEEQKGEKDKIVRHYITGQNHFVRRVFNNGSWERGGRFYGGWWQQMNKELRSDIMINGEPVIEIDFTAMHVSLLQAKVNEKPRPNLTEIKEKKAKKVLSPAEMLAITPDVNIRKPLDAQNDPYTLKKSVFPNKIGFDQRKAVKQLVLMAINANSRESAFLAFRKKQAHGDPLKKLKNNELSQLLEAFIDKNPTLEPFLGTGKGLELMYLDSRIAEIIIEQLTDKNIPVLCIHDSFIVAFKESKELQRAMKRASQKILGVSIELDILSIKLSDFNTGECRPLLPYVVTKDNNTCKGYLDRKRALNPPLPSVDIIPRHAPGCHNLNKNDGAT